MGASKTAAQIDIAWPSGIHQTLRNVAADRVVVVEEPSPAALRKK